MIRAIRDSYHDTCDSYHDSYIYDTGAKTIIFAIRIVGTRNRIVSYDSYRESYDTYYHDINSNFIKLNS